MTNDRRTTIDGDQIKDGTVTADELKFENSPTPDAIVAINASTKDFKYKSFAVIGQDFFEASSLGISVTTATSFQQKLRLTTGTLPVGKYRIGWSYSWNSSHASKNFNGRIQINDTTTVMEHVQEPKQNNGQTRYSSAFLYYSNESSQILNIDLDYAGTAGKTATIFNARLEIWRVS